MLRATLFALLAASPAFAQNASYITGLVQALNAAGLSSLANLAESVANTSTGQALFADIPNGNKTVFAPNNNAFTGSPPKNITDKNELAAILSYHVVSGSFTASNVSNAPAHTLLRTHLNDSTYVQLEGNKTQVLSLENNNNTVTVLNQNTNVRVLSSTSFQNLQIHVVNAVIDLPPKLGDALNAQNLSSLSTAGGQAGLLAALESTRGITVFAPNDQAFATALQALGGANNVNQSTLQTVLGNHVINGTSVYSTELSTGNYTSAAGEPFKFSSNSSGTYVSSGASTAKIVTSDVLVSNGVVHVIDGVLLNTQNNTQAASSAFASATSVAAQSTSQTGAVGGPTATGSNGKNGAIAVELPIRQLTVALFLTFCGAIFVI